MRDAAVLKLIVNEAIKDRSVILGLKSDVSAIKDKLGEHGLAIGAMQCDIRALRTGYNNLNHEVTVLKQDVAVLKQEVAILKQDVAVLKTDMIFVKEQLTYLGVSMEEMKQKMHLILDALRPSNELKRVRSKSCPVYCVDAVPRR